MKKQKTTKEVFELLSCITPKVEEGEVTSFEGLAEFEKKLKEIINAEKSSNSLDLSELCVIENELLGVRLTLGSKIYHVDELQKQGLQTIKKLLSTTPTRIPLGVG